MRLIDADAIHINIVGGRMNGKAEFAKAIEEAIKDAPTIEAIPVDWIITWWAHQGVPALSHCLENTDEVIRTMLRDWEKEYETN